MSEQPFSQSRAGEPDEAGWKQGAQVILGKIPFREGGWRSCWNSGNDLALDDVTGLMRETVPVPRLDGIGSVQGRKILGNG